ncbi:MAG: hypothetical protein OEZ02_05645 [Anaerolineae bacterium]|nr:hypothetical protein [Anaerolineae bacterium]
MKSNRGVVFLFFAACLLAACGAPPAAEPSLLPSPTPQPTTPQGVASPVLNPLPDKYLFIEVWVDTGGSGNLPQIRMDRPRYQFDALAGILDIFASRADISLAASQWGFIGQGQSLSGAAGGGAASQLVTIDRFPFELSFDIFSGILEAGFPQLEPVPVILLAVSEDGVLALQIGEQLTQLPVGESWSHRDAAELALDEYNGVFDIVSTITNYGWLDRSQIQTRD